MKVRKRNGNVVDFDGEKIVVAVQKAMAETDKGVDEEAARAVAREVTENSTAATPSTSKPYKTPWKFL